MNAMYRKFDDGCERCLTKNVNGREELVGYTGLVIPWRDLEPFVIAIQKGGLDTRALVNKQKDAG